ncbi:tRNA pseudouridine(55) synthase TruB [Desulforamulus aquiferis]|uniref:tRNA pseudouridine synthase B n=1 Tax=Desulforamulus aquiferis TaxID=1397668 RepID=A0AAW7ZDH7_9FIRM|nr:tRNA pseudouridine(55) synthase TruB [Desulforamulus aquiferis]MDO7787488.1 tRNA pseudouridine(55) synthase TruB [Desulforamulus aquiferis]
MDGFINVLKPPGMTSHDVVYFIRRVTGIKKCGHTGTLDPGAAGVLPVGLGKATRLSRFVTEGDKSYRAELTLGLSTTSQDAYGELLESHNAANIKPEDFQHVTAQFLGQITQVPPMASAIKVGGKRLYQLEREGQTVEVPARNVTIYDLQVVNSWEWQRPNPRVLFDVTCSKGTYVRTLCSDIGKALGCGAYMSFLLRTRVGDFRIEEALTLEEIKSLCDENKIASALVPMSQSVGQMTLVEINSSALKSVSSGATLYPRGIQKTSKDIAEGELVRVEYCGKLLGIYLGAKDYHEDKERIVLKPEVVFQTK